MNNDPIGVNEAVEDEMQIIVDNIKQNIISAGKEVTGTMSSSLSLKVKQSGQIFNIDLHAAKYFPVLETGRKPTPDKKPSREMIENIGDWAEAKGMEEGAAWGIATKINQEGTQLWKDGGRKDIYSEYFQPQYLRGVCDRVAAKAARGFAANLRSNLKPRK